MISIKAEKLTLIGINCFSQMKSFTFCILYCTVLTMAESVKSWWIGTDLHGNIDNTHANTVMPNKSGFILISQSSFTYSKYRRSSLMEYHVASGVIVCFSERSREL